MSTQQISYYIASPGAGAFAPGAAKLLVIYLLIRFGTTRTFHEQR
jgi:hypothetical protein